MTAKATTSCAHTVVGKQNSVTTTTEFTSERIPASGDIVSRAKNRFLIIKTFNALMKKRSWTRIRKDKGQFLMSQAPTTIFVKISWLNGPFKCVMG